MTVVRCSEHVVQMHVVQMHVVQMHVEVLGDC